jgi:signal transduction histidine kinase
MNKAKERAINHLSHELKTPLALISATLGTISNKLERGKVEGLDKSIDIARRNLNRLLRLQEEIDHIINDRPLERQMKVLELVEDAFHFVESLHGVSHGSARAALKLVSDYIGSIYRTHEEPPERFEAGDFLRSVLSEARRAMGSRELEITEDLSEATITCRRRALKKICAGILRNAIENTPDEGRIEVTGKIDPGCLVIRFRDFGTGITAENRKLIFSGFFHTQDTNLYSTKAPYEFNAGGAGADLLRARVFSERYGFLIDFESERCRHIPEDADQCPGRISLCRMSGGAPSCRDSGTVFLLKVPLKEN